MKLKNYLVHWNFTGNCWKHQVSECQIDVFSISSEKVKESVISLVISLLILQKGIQEIYDSLARHYAVNSSKRAPPKKISEFWRWSPIKLWQMVFTTCSQNFESIVRSVADFLFLKLLADYQQTAGGGENWSVQGKWRTFVPGRQPSKASVILNWEVLYRQQTG